MTEDTTPSRDLLELACSRRSFLAFTAGTAGVAGITTADGRRAHRAANGFGADTVGAAEGEPAPYPDNPFVQPSFGDPFIDPEAEAGYEAVGERQKLRTVLSLHPDVLAYDQLNQYDGGEIERESAERAQLELAQTLDRPATSGWNVNIHTDDADQRYGPLLENFDWRYPDGTPLESPTGILAETIDGQPYEISFKFDTLGTPSVFGPGGLDLLVETTVTQLERGYSGFFVDGVGIFRFSGVDVSVWAQAAFREHLRSLSDERLAELGVDDPGSFDFRSYVEAAGIAPNDDTDPRTDPLFREYLLFHHEGIDAWFDDYRATIAEQFPERMGNGDVALYANQFTGNFGNPQAANVYISDAMDVMYTELFPRVDPAVDVNYKLMQSVGNFSKPVVAKGTLTAISDERRGAIDPETPNPNLLRFQAAEAYANGSRLQLPLTARSGFSESDTVTNWVGPDGAVPTPLKSFADFLWAHKRFLTDVESAADVAVIWSLPTRVWRHEPGWGIGQNETPRLDSFLGTATLLREAGVAYDVVTFGHPRLWDDSQQLDRLSQYDAVVLPAIESITSDQLDALSSYLDGGGTVLASGPIPDRNGFYEPTDEPASVLDHRNVVDLEGDPGRRRVQAGERDGALVSALNGPGVKPVTVDDDPTVAANRLVQPGSNRHVVHLVNYDYDAGSDAFEMKNDVRIRLKAADAGSPVARYYSPQRQEDLEIVTDGDAMEVIVPELVEWGFVVVAPGESALVDGDPEAAEKRVNEARRRVEAARAADHGWSGEFAIAETQLEAAETALSYHAYTQASDAADEAIDAMGQATPEPDVVVGLDVGHGVEESYPDSEWRAAVADRLPSFEYQDVDSYVNDLDGVDLLVVPPALSFKGVEYGFTPDEIDAVKRFVREGGSLAVLARGGVADGVHEITMPFGFRFQNDPIIFPDRSESEIPVTGDSPLVDDVPGITAQLGSPIESVPDNGTVLARVSDNSDAWLHREQPLNERSDDEPSAAGRVVYATASAGEGEVALLGSPNYLVNPATVDFASEVLGNIFSVLGTEAAKRRLSTETTPSTGTETTGTGDTPVSTASNGTATGDSSVESESTAENGTANATATSSPGLGFGSAVAALGLSVWRRVQGAEEDE